MGNFERKVSKEKEKRNDDFIKRLQKQVGNFDSSSFNTNVQPAPLKGFLVVCNECKKEFHLLRARDLKTLVDTENDKHTIYYECPYCNHRHIVCYLNDELIMLSKQIAAAKAIMPASVHGTNAKLERVNALLSEYREKLDALNNKKDPIDDEPESKVADVEGSQNLAIMP